MVGLPKQKNKPYYVWHDCIATDIESPTITRPVYQGTIVKAIDSYTFFNEGAVWVEMYFSTWSIPLNALRPLDS